MYFTFFLSSLFNPMLPLFWLLISVKTGLRCATMFSSVAVRGTQSVDTLVRPGKLCREMAFEWPEITWPWVESTNICCSVQDSFDFLEVRELGDLGPKSGRWQRGLTFLTASGSSGQRRLCKRSWNIFSKHFTCLFYEEKIIMLCNYHHPVAAYRMTPPRPEHLWTNLQLSSSSTPETNIPAVIC